LFFLVVSRKQTQERNLWERSKVFSYQESQWKSSRTL